jgi:hypothetical protein
MQRNIISELWSHKDLIVYPKDKTLGPSFADCSKYIRDVLETHLLNDANYEFLPPNKVKEELKNNATISSKYTANSAIYSQLKPNK